MYGSFPPGFRLAYPFVLHASIYASILGNVNRRNVLSLRAQVYQLLTVYTQCEYIIPWALYDHGYRRQTVLAIPFHWPMPVRVHSKTRLAHIEIEETKTTPFLF
jgi:hypothetical protein